MIKSHFNRYRITVKGNISATANFHYDDLEYSKALSLFQSPSHQCKNAELENFEVSYSGY